MKQFWGWELATYLYLGGLGGGMLTFAAIIGIILSPSEMTSAMLVWPVLMAIIVLVVGTGLLVFELGQWKVFYRAFVTRTAVIKWGAVFLSISMIFAALFLVFEVSWFSFLPFIPWEGVARFCLGVAGFFGACVMLYTGTMLSSLKAKAFWNTPALPMLFTISALSTGACLLALCYGAFPLPSEWLMYGDLYNTAEWAVERHEAIELMHVIDLILVIVEIVAMLLYVLLMFCAPPSVDAKKVANRWVRGNWAFVFWGLMIGCGLVIPLLCNIHGLAMGGSVLGNYVAPVFALLGGLLFRFMIIWSGDRKLYPGEEKYYERLVDAGHGKEFKPAFMRYWDEGYQYWEEV